MRDATTATTTASTGGPSVRTASAVPPSRAETLCSDKPIRTNTKASSR